MYKVYLLYLQLLSFLSYFKFNFYRLNTYSKFFFDRLDFSIVLFDFISNVNKEIVFFYTLMVDLSFSRLPVVFKFSYIYRGRRRIKVLVISNILYFIRDRRKILMLFTEFMFFVLTRLRSLPRIKTDLKFKGCFLYLINWTVSFRMFYYFCRQPVGSNRNRNINFLFFLKPQSKKFLRIVILLSNFYFGLKRY